MQFTVDRIEGNKVVLLLREDETQKLVVLRSSLPAEVHEGSILRADLSLDPEKEQDARMRVNDLINKLVRKAHNQEE